ncbi:RNA-binding protein [Candidatus Geothermarchaeota archaeon]|nr:MAG: RNA-binding protein [Candidatus Geothermarchaeota archaeon]
MREKKQPLSVYLLSKQVRQLIELNKRIDGRDLYSFREMRIKTGIVEKADGSAVVELGKTMVVAGVKFEIGAPFPDSPDEGILIVEGEILPLASVSEEPGPPTEEEIELSRVIDRGIRGAKVINLKDLAIKPGEKVLKVFVDFNVMNDAGNVIDASNIAVISALLTAKYPDIKELKGGRDINEASRVQLPTHNIPISVTFANLFGKLVVDPITEEEVIADARLTLTLTSEERICAVQKGGSGTLTFNQLFEALNIARRVSNDIRKLVIRETGVRHGQE